MWNFFETRGFEVETMKIYIMLISRVKAKYYIQEEEKESIYALNTHLIYKKIITETLL